MKCRRALFGHRPIVESSPQLWLSDCLLLSSSPLEVVEGGDSLGQQQGQLSLEEFSQRRQQPPEAEEEEEEDILDGEDEEDGEDGEDEDDEDDEKDEKDEDDEDDEEEEIEVPLPADVIEVTADRQEFDQRRQIITARGSVLIRFRQGAIDADRVQINLQTRQLVAQGNAAFTRGEQVLRGETMAYNLTLGTGNIERASGELFVPTTGTDFSGQPPAEGLDNATVIEAPLSDRLTAAQPLKVKSGGRGASVGVGVGSG